MAHFRRDCPEKNLDGSKNAASVGLMDIPQMGKWLVDSGASSHMTWEKELLSDYREFEKPEKVVLGDGRTVEAVRVGNVNVI